MVFLYWYYGNLDGPRITIGFMYRSRRIQLNMIRLYWMDITSSVALDMNGSLHHIFSYLPNNEQGELGV